MNPPNQQNSISDPINFHHFQSICQICQIVKFQSIRSLHILFYDDADDFCFNIIFTLVHNTTDLPDNNDLSLPLFRALGLSMD